MGFRRIIHLLLIMLISFPLMGSNGSGSKKTKLIYAIDGLSYEIFMHAKNNLNLFKEFNSTSSNIAPFPSISGYAWNVILQSKEIDPRRGRIKFPESAYYSDLDQSLNDDPRNFFVHAFNRNLNLARIDIKSNLYLESLGYLSKTEIRKHEVKDIEDQLINHQGGDLIISYLASLDGVAHLHKNQIDDALKDIDNSLIRIQEELKKRGFDLEIFLISDHGQASSFNEGEEERPLLSAKIEKSIQKSGLRMVRRLEKENDIIVPVLALANYVPFYFKNRRNINKYIENVKQEKWFDLAIYREIYTEVNKVPSDLIEVIIESKNGRAKVSYNKETKKYFYKDVLNNPLKVNKSLINRYLSIDELSINLKNEFYPDSIVRIIEGASHNEMDFPDLIITMKDSYKIVGSLDQFVSMNRTHGSLSKRSSMGILASNKKRSFDEYTRSKDILSEIQVKVSDIYYRSNFKKTIEADSLLSELAAKPIKLTPYYLSAFLTKGVDLSRYLFDKDSLNKVTLNILEKGDSIENILNSNRTSVPKDLVKPSEIGELIDASMNLMDIDKIQETEIFERLKNRIDKRVLNKKDENEIVSLSGGHTHKVFEFSDTIKKASMKAYAIPAMLNGFLDFPEFRMVKDERDHDFYQNYTQSKESGKYLNDFSLKKEDLFKEIFIENKILEKLKPMDIAALYPWHIPADTTIVFVPGIYDSIFDGVIFKKALKNLEEVEGLRVIKPTIESSCSSKKNGTDIVNFLKEDQKQRILRGHIKPKYFLLGYSKGGIDSLNALLEDKGFSKNYVLGLLTIASPLNGSSILNKTNLPFQLVDMLSEKNMPEICRENKLSASSSITPQAMHEFWKKNMKELLGLTRYYSVSFESEMEDSHTWMRATKIIGQFGIPNDGVVTVEDSFFPKNLNATSFGVVKGADHLAGLITSGFEQEAFLKSLLATVYESNGFDQQNNDKFNQYIKSNSSILEPEDHKKRITDLLDPITIGGGDISKQSLKELEVEIKKVLQDNFYPVVDFKLSKSLVKKELQVTYWGKKGHMPYRFKIKVNNKDDLINAILSKLQKSERNLLKSNSNFWDDLPETNRERVNLPDSSSQFNVDERLEMMDIVNKVKKNTFNQSDQNTYPEGIKIIYDHKKSDEFRNEYGFNFEYFSPAGSDNNLEVGYASVLGDDGEIYAQLKSKSNSIKSTSYRWRFMAKDFKNIEIKYQVNQPTIGADNLKGGNGKDDSPFRLLFAIRELKDGSNPARITKEDKDTTVALGYYWGNQMGNQKLEDGKIYESSFSRKKIMGVHKLPEMKQVLLGFKKEDLGKVRLFQSSLYEHIKEAFPWMDPDKAQIISISIHHDSNDTESSGDALFKHLIFTP